MWPVVMRMVYDNGYHEYLTFIGISYNSVHSNSIDKLTEIGVMRPIKRQEIQSKLAF
jgi:hypothetical protein